MEATIMEQQESGSIPLAFLGGGAAAIVAGITWGSIVFITKHELGFMALWVGFLVGYTIVFLSKGRGLIFQLIAVFMSLLGVILGQYISYFLLMQQVFTEIGVAEPAAQVFSPVSLISISFFVARFIDMYTLLWTVLAAYIAWKMTAEPTSFRAPEPWEK